MRRTAATSVLFILSAASLLMLDRPATSSSILLQHSRNPKMPKVRNKISTNAAPGVVLTASTESTRLQSILDATVAGNFGTVKHLVDSMTQAQQTIPYQLMAVAATERGHADIVNFCFSVGDAKVDTDIVVAAGRGSSPDLYAVLMKYGWPPKLDLSWILSFDALKGSALVDFLIKSGAKVREQTVWIIAVSGDAETIKVLEAHGIKVFGPAAAGALQLAAAEGEVDRVKMLLEKGVPVDAMPKEDSMDERECRNGTPLHRAVEYGRSEVVKVLLDHGADPSKVDQRGWTVFVLAEKYGRKDIIALLKERPSL